MNWAYLEYIMTGVNRSIPTLGLMIFFMQIISLLIFDKGVYSAIVSKLIYKAELPCRTKPMP